MTPDPKQRLPRELLRELIEEGSEAFRGVLEKLINAAMQLEREEFLGARRWERSEQRRDHANGYKDKTLSTRVGQLRIRIPQVRHLDFYPRSLERGCRSEKALKLAIAEMYVMGVSTRKVTEITEQLCGTEISASQVSRISKLLDDELEQRAAIATDIRDIFNAPSGGEGEAMLRTRVEQYRDRNPELADWMETNLPEGFTVFRFARSTWRRIRTNNGLENLNRQIRRRTRVVGIFPNTESALRLITAVVEEIHEDWLIGKQYLSLVDFNPQENPVSDRSQSNYRKTVA